MIRVEINPSVVSWAMNRAQAGADDLGVPIETLEAWLSKDKHPTFKQAQDLARHLHIPFGYLFLSSVPETEIPIPDLRTIKNTIGTLYSPEFIDVLYDALRKQSWYRNYRIEQGYEPLDFVGSFDTSVNPEMVASSMREKIDTDELRQKATSWDNYLTHLTRQAEEIGIVVLRSGTVGSNTHRTLSVEEFRGFALVDTFAPIVFLNTRDTKAARVFTLAHELAHIWVGQSAISDINLKEIPANTDSLERFCNTAAAEFLVPRMEFSRRWKSTINPLELANDLARFYRVSILVVLRRAFDLNLLEKSLYFSLYDQALQQLRTPDSNGGTFFPAFYARNSHRFTNDLIGAVSSGQETYRRAASLLGADVPLVSKLVSEQIGGLSSGEVSA